MGEEVGREVIRRLVPEEFDLRPNPFHSFAQTPYPLDEHEAGQDETPSKDTRQEPGKEDDARAQEDHQDSGKIDPRCVHLMMSYYGLHSFTPIIFMVEIRLIR